MLNYLLDSLLSQNLIAPLTRFVLAKVVDELPNLPQCSSFHIAINVAASHFRDRAIVEDLQSIWWPANPLPKLVVELTELLRRRLTSINAGLVFRESLTAASTSDRSKCRA